MDGLQVLSIVRRKYPQLRTVVLTSVVDEQFRSRVYALGVDLFWNKPSTEQEIKLFLECIESLLGREVQGGFRGVQSKSLMDIIQLECLSQSSALLRISNGNQIGKIWIQHGELIDAEEGNLTAEAAFFKILSWRTGMFETLPAEPSRPRKISKSYNTLLLESAQALDESRGAEAQNGATSSSSPMTELLHMEGVEFVLAMKLDPNSKPDARGLENPERMAEWARQSLERFGALGDRLQAGPLEQIAGMGPQRHVALTRQNDTQFCVGWRHSMTLQQVHEMMKKVLALWAS
jgi:CheY-like chemotaxis protein